MKRKTNRDRRPARQCQFIKANGQRCEVSTRSRKPGNLGVALCHHHGGK